MARAGSTIPPEEADGLRRARAGRRMGVTAMALLIVAGVAGLTGVRSAVAVASRAGTRLAVSYPAAARGGLAVRIVIDVQRPAEVTGPVEVTLPASYLELLDLNAITPEPADQERAGDVVTWTFAQPEAGRLTVGLDARIEPSHHRGRAGSVSLQTPDGPLAVRFRTTIFP